MIKFFVPWLSPDPRIAFGFLHSVWFLRLQLLAGAGIFVCAGELHFSPFSGHQKLWLSPGRLRLLALALVHAVRLLLLSQQLRLLLRVLRGRALGHPQSRRVLLLPQRRLCELCPLSSHCQRVL